MRAPLLLAAAILCPGPPVAAQGTVPAQVSACSAPGPVSCADQIAAAIDAAGATIRVQAYWFTSLPILRALAGARRRGLDVEVILDKTQDRRADPHGRYSSAVFLVHAGIPVWIDDAPAIAHNKVIDLTP